jgi:mono/diheme cytochrome c family protein
MNNNKNAAIVAAQCLGVREAGVSEPSDAPQTAAGIGSVCLRGAAAFGVAMAAAGLASPAWPGNAAAGRATYVAICSTCHGMNGIGSVEYVPSFSKCETLNKDDATLRTSVREGIGGRMPPWGVYLSDGEIDDAIAFARTFCKR